MKFTFPLLRTIKFLLHVTLTCDKSHELDSACLLGPYSKVSFPTDSRDLIFLLNKH